MMRQKSIVGVERWLMKCLCDSSWLNDSVESENDKTDDEKKEVETSGLFSEMFSFVSINVTSECVRRKHVQIDERDT